MGLLLWLCSLVCLLLHFSLFHAHVVADSFNTSFVQLPCRDDERSALLQFKQSFVIKRYASFYEDAYPKVLSWRSEGESSNCCFWEGVECDEKTGHVIGLILNSSCLYGSINSNSTLFRLVHLQKLNLADNHFNYSLIPSAIGQFSGLTYLNLSYSKFYGQIPFEISHLSKLAFLDLSPGFNMYDPLKQYRLLELKNPNLGSLIQNLTSLEGLRLTSVYIPSTVPDILVNFTSLRWLYLQNCGLYGKFPTNIFYLPNLQVLNLGWNKNLTGYLPEFHQRSPLEWLALPETGFSGSIPSSIEMLELLQVLDLWRCNFSRPLPSSLSKLTQLTYLFLGGNHLDGQIPSWLGNLSQLSVLWLQDNNLSGNIPSSFQKLTKLTSLNLAGNQMIGLIPSWIGNLSQLSVLVLEDNNLSGSIPSSFQKLTKLWELDLSFNLFHGQLPVPPTSIQYYSISNNLLKGEIPPLLCNLNSLQLLDLSSNKLSGVVPQCLEKLNSLSVLNLGNNSFYGVIPHVCTFPSNLKMMDLSKNKFEGRLPRSLAACTLLEFLDVGQNELTDVFPAWLGTLPEFKLLNLRHNGFYGDIKMPNQSFLFPKLRVIDLSYNSFAGKFPFQYLLFLSAMKGINSSNSRYMEVWQVVAQTKNYESHFYYYFYSTTIVNKGIERYYMGIQEDFAEIDFSCNKFNGEIPQFIENLKALRSLNCPLTIFRVVFHLPWET